MSYKNIKVKLEVWKRIMRIKTVTELPIHEIIDQAIDYAKKSNIFKDQE